ncbi:hypothetical protein [Kitasatospora cinereorecta]|uniref:DUF3040 domain-containing protein n=1 Tax=Kitasatospora cinereorecta TaxID=285560 RepID=A0ABW0VQ88_9ACTN
MDGPALSHRELLILGQIEAALRTDRLLERRLRTMRFSRSGRLRRTLRRRPQLLVGVLAALLVLSSALLATGVVLGLPLLIAAVASAWAAGFAGLLLFTRRHAP